MKFVEDLEFLHFNTSQPGIFQRHCESAYRLWEAQWTQTFVQLGVSKRVFSDDFLNRELGGLFLGTQAVGFMLYAFLDFAHPAYSKVQYFQNYPEKIWELHQEHKDLVMAPTLMTLSNDWRRSQTNHPISELLFGFAVLRFLDSPADRLIGYARNDLKMNEVLYRHGGTPLAQNVVAYNVPVDFIEITRLNARLSDQDESAVLTLQLWNKTKSKINPLQKTMIQKRGEKNHVITVYNQENGPARSIPVSMSVGKQSVLPGLARPSSLLHELQHENAGDGSWLVST